jgi:acetylornithine deacetylase
MVSGGTGMSTYAASATVQIERRTIPGETTEQVTGEIRRLIAECVREDPTFAATLSVVLVREPFEVARNRAIVRTLSDAATAVLGEQPPYVGENPWMDSALLSAAGIETVVMGPHGAGAHAKEEWVDVRSVVQFAEVLAAAAARYCA